MEPAHGSLDDPTSSPQAAAMLGVPSRRDRFDAPLLEHGSMTLGVVRPVALNSLGPAARSSRLAAHGRYRIHQRDHLGNVVFVGTSQRGRERNAVRVGREVVLAPLSPAICGIATRFFPRAKHGSWTSRRRLVTSRSCRRPASGPARSRAPSSKPPAFAMLRAAATPSYRSPSPIAAVGIPTGLPSEERKESPKAICDCRSACGPDAGTDAS